VSRDDEFEALMARLSELPRAQSDTRRALKVRKRCHGRLRGRWRSLILDPLSLIFERILDPQVIKD